ncbi:MAG: hypothetical protein Q8Q09_28055 [Deltaproteobacteria bacterium]|nr:hypothetical protein [Deltaproteobacteria bacterium]
MSTEITDTITWNEGGAASVRTAREIEVVVRSSVPYPPGKPAGGTLRHDTQSLAFTLKVARSQKVSEGLWDVRGRLLDATVAVRAAFAAQSARVAELTVTE